MSELDLHDNVRDDVRIDLLCEDVVALTECLRLKELECQQLADDNAKLRESTKKLETIKLLLDVKQHLTKFEASALSDSIENYLEQTK